MPRTIGIPEFSVLAVGHVLLALVMMRWPIVATVHAWGTLLIGLYLAFGGRQFIHLAWYAGYVAGCEVLWRMTDARVFWEMGKYIIIATLGIALLHRHPKRSSVFPLVFAIAFLPSCVLTLSNMPLHEAREQISFNLSGPIALAVSAAFFQRLRLTRSKLSGILLSFLIPVMGILAVVILTIATSDKLVFNGESNRSMSGGFGPNQVSCVLGFAAVVALVMSVSLLPQGQRALRTAFFLLALVLGTQSALTFSRSGVYLAVLSLGSALLLATHHRATRRALVVSAVVVVVLAYFLILPQIDAFTHGMFSKRFTEVQLTGRDDIMKADLLIWIAHPILGVGPGQAVEARAEFFERVAAHSEFTRALAEHGSLGLIAIILLLIEVSRNFLRVESDQAKFLVASLAAFGLLFMASNAMRIALTSLAIGITFGTFSNEIEKRSRSRKLSIELPSTIT